MTLHLAEDVLDFARCPAAGCSGGQSGLELVDGDLRCESCAAAYPTWADVAVLVPDPAAYAASYREPILAALAEFGRATPAAVQSVLRWSERRSAEPLRFGDDWTAHERVGDCAPFRYAPPHTDPPFGLAGALDASMSTRQGRMVEHAVLASAQEHWSAAPPDQILEIGPGAGQLSTDLAASARGLWLVDLNLRAVLLARQRAAEAHAAPAHGVVADAQSLPFVSEAFSDVFAMNVVDLVDDPKAMVRSVAGVLEPGGSSWWCTPRPDSLGPSGDHLTALLRGAEFTTYVVAERMPWVRAHDDRFAEVYFVDALRGTRPD